MSATIIDPRHSTCRFDPTIVHLSSRREAVAAVSQTPEEDLQDEIALRVVAMLPPMADLADKVLCLILFDASKATIENFVRCWEYSRPGGAA